MSRRPVLAVVRPEVIEQMPAGLRMATLMLTDIENSCRRWETDPAAMRRALLLHDRLIDDAVREHDGTVLTSHGEGDSIFAAFRLASQAVTAACSIQRALQRRPWPSGRRLRVRIALHSGEVKCDYRGRIANRCARLRGLARGGQVLLSGVTADLVRPWLPPGASLRHLGRHSLRDLGPERVFQLVIADLPPTDWHASCVRGGGLASEAPVGRGRPHLVACGLRTEIGIAVRNPASLRCLIAARSPWAQHPAPRA